MTIALQYLKEVDIISTRRQEITVPKSQPRKLDAEGRPKVTPKKKSKGRGKGTSQDNQVQGEEEA